MDLLGGMTTAGARGLAAALVVALLAVACASGQEVTSGGTTTPGPSPDAAVADDSTADPAASDAPAPDDPGTADPDRAQAPLGIVIGLPTDSSGGMTAQGRPTDADLPAKHGLASAFGFIAVDRAGLWVGVAGPIRDLRNACLNVSFKTAANEFPPAAQLTADLGGCPEYEQARITPGDPRLYTNLAVADEYAARNAVPAAFAQTATSSTGVVAIRVEEFEAPDGERLDGFLVGMKELSMWVYVQRRQTAEGVQWFKHHFLVFLGWKQLRRYGANRREDGTPEEALAATDRELEELFETDVAGVQIDGDDGNVWFFALGDTDYQPPADLVAALEPMLEAGPK